MTPVVRDGDSWLLGTAEDVAWIAEGTSVGLAITAAIPAVFDAYATITLSEGNCDQEKRDTSVLSLLRAHSTGQRWWLGYLDTGNSDVVFPDAPKVILYAGAPYVLVQGGPEQAATWRGGPQNHPFEQKFLPDLIFPTNRAWLASTLWDDDWTCIGGSRSLIRDLLRHPLLQSCARQVQLTDDATPPGHQAI